MMVARCIGLAGVAVLLLLELAQGQGVVGPGGVTPYSGGGGRRSGGYGTVRDPPAGFFIGGSSIKEMNGVYTRVEKIPSAIDHKFHYAYRKWPVDKPDDMTGWHMALVKCDEETAEKYECTDTSKNSEWLIIDPARKDRFGHEGDTIIPGAGTRWKHLHRKYMDPDMPAADGTEVAEGTEDDMDELPWQVIYIGDPNMVHDFRRREYGYHRNIQQAIGAVHLPRTSGCHGPTPAGDCAHEEQPPGADELGAADVMPIEAAQIAEAEGDFERAVKLYDAEIAANCPKCLSPHSRNWRLASLHKAKADAQRRARDFPAALDSIVAAVGIFPRYKDAIFCRGRTLIDAGKNAVALKHFEQLLRLDREYPDLLTWLTKAKANTHRADEAARKAREVAGAIGPGTSEPSESDKAAEAALEAAIKRTGYASPPSTPKAVDHYAILGLSHDFTPAELKRRYKKASLAAHPDRAGGSTEAFEAVAAAYEVLGDEAKRAAYDIGDDIPREVQQHDGQEGPSHATKVERAYFPERFGFDLFGDPHESKREYEKEQKRNAPPVPNAEGIPAGTYTQSCNGCSMDEEGKVLTCTQCKHWSMQSRNWDMSESSIRPSVCTPEEWLGNRDGTLACEPKPQTVLEEEARAAGEAPPDLDAQLDDTGEAEPNKGEL